MVDLLRGNVGGKGGGGGGFFSKSVKKLDDTDLVGNYKSKKDLVADLEEKREKRKYEFSKAGVALWCCFIGCLGCYTFLSYWTFAAMKSFYYVIAAGSFALVTGTTTVVNQHRIHKQNTMREVQNAMRSEVNRFKVENEILKKNIDQLASEVERLKPVERKLRGTVARNGDNTDKLVDLVAQNRLIIDEMKELLKAEVVQDMMAIVLDSDVDGDFHISDEEVEILILRLSVVEGVEKINRQKMKEILEQKGGSLAAVMDVVKNIMSSQDDDNDINAEFHRIVTLDPMKRKPHKPQQVITPPPSLSAASSDSDDTIWG